MHNFVYVKWSPPSLNGGGSRPNTHSTNNDRLSKPVSLCSTTFFVLRCAHVRVSAHKCTSVHVSAFTCTLGALTWIYYVHVSCTNVHVRCTYVHVSCNLGHYGAIQQFLLFIYAIIPSVIYSNVVQKYPYTNGLSTSVGGVGIRSTQPPSPIQGRRASLYVNEIMHYLRNSKKAFPVPFCGICKIVQGF